MSNCAHNHKPSLWNRIRRRFLSAPAHDHGHGFPGCAEWRLDHHRLPNGLILTLVFHRDDGVIEYFEAHSLERARQLGEAHMAEYDINRVARAGDS